MFRHRKSIALVLFVALAAGWSLWGRLKRPRGEDGRPTAVASPRPEASPLLPTLPSRATSSFAVLDDQARACVFVGRVIAADTRLGIPGASLIFETGGAAFTAKADASGGFDFTAAKPGLYHLAAISADGYFPYAPEWGFSSISLLAQPGKRLEGLVVTLRPSVEYLARVIDLEGKPVPEAEVALLGDWPTMRLMPLQSRFTSDASGEFRFRAPVGAVLEARHGGFSPGRHELVEADRRGRIELTLGKPQRVVEEALAIRGRVLDEMDVPVEGAVVTAAAAHGSDSLVGMGIVTDPNGEFRLGGLKAGEYWLEASARAKLPARVKSVAGADSVELRLGRGGVLRGTVREARSGAPVTSFTLSVSARSDSRSGFPVLTQAFVSPGGEFEVKGVPPGELGVRARSQGYSPSKEAAVTLDESAQPLEVDISLEHGATLTGVVVDETTHAAIAHATLSIEGSAPAVDSPLATTSGSAVCDDRGRFEVAGISSGLHSISVQADGYRTRLLSGTAFRDGEGFGPITVELAALQAGEPSGFDFVGIGAVLQANAARLTVARVLPASGAAQAQIEAGDVILSIDGTPTSDLSLQEALDRIRGIEGTYVQLSLQKASGQAVDVAVQRSRVRG